MIGVLHCKNGKYHSEYGMSAITIENDLVHYEALGRGRPVILIHGWLGSWRYWVPAMRQLSGSYRTYALDLWGFGDSGRDKTRYDFDSHVKLLGQFMDKMGIEKAALIGHDLGAAISTRFARENKDRVPRLLTVSPALFQMSPESIPLTNNTVRVAAASDGAKPEAKPPAKPEAKPDAAATSAASPAEFTEAETIPKRPPELDKLIREAAAKAAAKSPQEAAVVPTDKPVKEVSTTELPALKDVPSMPRAQVVKDDGSKPNPLRDHLEVFTAKELLQRHVDPGTDRDKLQSEADKADEAVIQTSVESFAGVNTLADMLALSMPAVMVYGARDTFCPTPQKEILDALLAKDSPFKSIELKNIRHFPMLEDIAAFTRLLLEFLKLPDVRQLDIKEIWERRVR